MKNIALIISLLVISFPVHAQASSIESQAIRCAGLASVHTSLILTNSSFAKAMTTIGQSFVEIYASQRSRRTSLAVTTSDVSMSREDVFDQLRKAWLDNPKAVVDEAALCNEWRTGIVAGLGSESIPLSGGFLASLLSRPIPEPSAKASQSEIEKWESITPRAFSAWFESSRCETCLMRAQLKQMLEQPGRVQRR